MSDSTAKPFDDIRNLVTTMPERDASFAAGVTEVAQGLARDLRPLGRLDAPLAEIAAWQGAQVPRLARPLIAVFAGTHGVAAHLSDEDPVQASQARVASLTEGAAAVRGMASDLGAAFKVYEFGIEYPSEDFTTGDSLSERDCAAAIAFGMEVVAEGADVIVLGNAGLGAATSAAAIAMALYGGTSKYWAGGNNAEARIAAVETGLDFHRGGSSDPLDVLRRFGGRDIAGMVGAILAARHQRIPVLLDGYVVCAAAAVLHAIDPNATSHCLAAHVSAEPAHDALLSRLGLTPILDIGVNIGDGAGSALALSVLKTAAAGLTSLKDHL
jgi:nicotinate-nucleotide--dimethylbenzimidazole phosphoribosyltransferase